MSKSAIILSTITVFQFVSMAFLIICCVTAPVFRQIGLSKYNDITYGVFGYCHGNSCSKASASYNPSQFQENNDNWTLNNHTRDVLGKILIVTPIAAGLNFFSFLSSFISIIIVTLQNNNTFSAVLFFINFLFTLFGFLSASLMCIVIFLLFYPNMTWCSWLLIPAAALQLINIPIIFISYFNSRSDDENSLDYTDDGDHLLSKEFETDGTNINHYTGKNLTSTVLPTFQPQNSNNKISTDLYQKDTLISNSTTDVSYNPYLEKKEDYYTGTFERNSTSGLSSDIDRGSNNQIEENKEEDTNINEPMDENIDAKRDSFVAFSAIDSDAALHKTNSPSITSSNFSNKNLHKNAAPTNKLLQDIYNPPSSNHDTLQNIQQKNNSIDNMSDFTSISQTQINPNYSAPINNNYNPNANYSNVIQNLPYPHSPSTTSFNYVQQSQQFPYQQPQKQSSIPIQNTQQPTNQYRQPMVSQQRFPQYQQHYTPTGPDASEILLQNNPNFIPQTRSLGAKKRFYNNPTMPNTNMNTYRGPSHFQNAYKRRVADRNNIYNNLHSTLNNPYEFR